MTKTLLIQTLLVTVLLGFVRYPAFGVSAEAPSWRVVEFFREMVDYWKRSDLVDEGDLAPDFELLPLRVYDLDLATHYREVPRKNGAIRLSDFRGFKPVALVFGSYT